MGDHEPNASQWIDLGEITRLLDTPRSEALRALKLRGLANVRPAVLTIGTTGTTLLTVDDSYALGCIEKLLTPHCDWVPGDDDDPQAATVSWHKLALLDWFKGTDLDFDLTELKGWKRDVYPTLHDKGLCCFSLSWQTQTQAARDSVIKPLTLTPDELFELTGRKQHGKQHEILNRMRIYVRGTRPDGSLVVLHSDVEADKAQPVRSKAKPQLNLDALD